jgi:PhnB protein
MSPRATKAAAKIKAHPASKKPASKKAAAKKPASARPHFPLAPHLTCRGAAKAIEFYKKAFDAKELMRLPGPDDRLMHASVEINGAMVMLTDEWPEHGGFSPLALKGTPVTIHLNVDDVDKWFKRAVKAGAIVRMPVADMFWGDRYGIVTDPYGHSWSLATHKKDMTVAEIQQAMKKMSASPPSPAAKK